MVTNIMDRACEPECDSLREFVFRANIEEVNIMQYCSNVLSYSGNFRRVLFSDISK